MLSSKPISDRNERLAVMMKQESSKYRCNDYLGRDPPPQFTSNQYPSSTSVSLCSSTSSSTGVNELWREKICEWSYQVVDHFDFNREVVSISLSYLDRFLSTRRVKKKIFQLAAMTTLYIAIRLYETSKFSPSSLIALSRGFFTVEHITMMEYTILRALSWHMHPPTPLCLVRHLVDLLPSDNSNIDLKVKYDITELSRFLTELSVCDYFFVTRRSSCVALASITVAIEILTMNGAPLETLEETFLPNVKAAFPNFKKAEFELEITECRVRLRTMYDQGGYNHQKVKPNSDNEEQPQPVREMAISPVCVTRSVPMHNSTMIAENHYHEEKTVKSGAPSLHKNHEERFSHKTCVHLRDDLSKTNHAPKRTRKENLSSYNAQ